MITVKTMTLSEYFDPMTPEQRECFAQRCGTSVGYLKHIKNGHKNASATLAINIDRESGGLVKKESLCPEADWAYIEQSVLDKVQDPTAA